MTTITRERVLGLTLSFIRDADGITGDQARLVAAYVLDEAGAPPTNDEPLWDEGSELIENSSFGSEASKRRRAMTPTQVVDELMAGLGHVDWQDLATKWMKRASYFQGKLMRHGVQVSCRQADAFYIKETDEDGNPSPLKASWDSEEDDAGHTSP